jgi:hypothetical protein
MAPTFPQVLRMARERGFLDVAVVTNGSLLDEERVAAALLEHASTIRLSLYDWDSGSCAGLYPTLKRIERLRSRVDRECSALQIGVGALTSSENANALQTVAREAASAGAHWIYFHPTCTRWEAACPTAVDQDGVLAQIDELRAHQPDGFRVFVLRDRYVKSPIEFAAYHAACFLLVIGADGLNYLGAEVKYRPQHAIADVAGNWRDDFLWQRPRMERINSVNSQTYPAIGSRHRGVLYSHWIQQLLAQSQGTAAETLATLAGGFLFPHIL